MRCDSIFYRIFNLLPCCLNCWKLVVKLLTQQLDQALSTEVQLQIEALPLLPLEALSKTLSETLLDFTRLEDLLTWLQVNQPSERVAQPVQSTYRPPEASK